MDSNITGKLKFPPLDHIGMVVKDLEKVLEYYSWAFGIESWVRREGESESKAHGQIYVYKTKTAEAKLGPVTLELFQLREGRSPVHSEFLDKGREGLHHFGFSVSKEERDRIIADLAKIGVRVFQESQIGSASAVWLNTEKIGGVFFELAVRSTE